jgi:hypothetical protein
MMGVYEILFNMVDKIKTQCTDDKTALCIVSDHGNIPVKKYINTNSIMIREGWSIFSENNQTFRNFDNTNGLQLGQFNDGSAILLSNGDLAFGGIHGLNVFSPKMLLSSQEPPEVVFTEMEVKSRNPGADVFKKATDFIYSKNPISLSFNQNTLMIRYVAISQDKFPFQTIYDVRLGQGLIQVLLYKVRNFQLFLFLFPLGNPIP